MPNHAFSTILFETHDANTRITLNRPDKLNAFSTAMQVELRQALEMAGDDHRVRAIVLTGAGRSFSAGQDLAERQAALACGELDLGRLLEENYHPIIRLIETLPVPVIAAVNGMAVGAAAALALGCDVAIIARSASFRFPFVKIALSPDAGTSFLLTRLIGRQRAMAVALSGGQVDAAEAHAWGMVACVVDDHELLTAAHTMARDFASGSRAAIASTKKIMRDVLDLSFASSLAAESSAQQARGRHPDYREAIAAFAERRPANFAV